MENSLDESDGKDQHGLPFLQAFTITLIPPSEDPPGRLRLGRPERAYVENGQNPDSQRTLLQAFACQALPPSEDPPGRMRLGRPRRVYDENGPDVEGQNGRKTGAQTQTNVPGGGADGDGANGTPGQIDAPKKE
jgi:hypothetical protein